MVILLLFSGLQLAACAQAPVTATEPPPAVVEAIDDTEFNRVTLSPKAAERLDIQTAPVREEAVNGTTGKVIPYSALIYDLNGETWIYTSVADLTYVRAPVTVDFIDADVAVLAEGPDVGTEVVTVAVAELYGTDTGVGK
jgi:hypothetical protein